MVVQIGSVVKCTVVVQIDSVVVVQIGGVRWQCRSVVYGGSADQYCGSDGPPELYLGTIDPHRVPSYLIWKVARVIRVVRSR